MRDVGVLPLSKELEARSGQPEKHLTVYSYCSPLTARKMVDFSPHMAAYLPCRISVVERDDGLWLAEAVADPPDAEQAVPEALQPSAQALGRLGPAFSCLVRPATLSYDR